MFEKEAEEYERRKHHRYEDNDYCGNIADGIIQAYQQGAEFGYNKCREEFNQIGLALQSDMDKTIEQNAEESQIEEGVVSISGSVEKHYRPFKDCSELIEHYQEKYKSAVGCYIYFPSLYNPSIWVKRYEHIRDVLMNRTFLITGYEDSRVVVDNKRIGMDELFEKYKFLDDSPVGKFEE